MKQNFPSPSEATDLIARLSERQRECLLLVKEGLTSKEIARFLSLSPSTIDNHLNAAIERLGCSSRGVAARILEAAEHSEDCKDSDIFRQDNKIRTEYQADQSAERKLGRGYLMPPLGGAANAETTARRIMHIGLIAIAATMAFSAITITIAGVVELFSR